ncbi:MAG TPA: HAMP domain-containing sensor histidine kinase [Steroidobacteraceae bacterium]|nr:HAMP domain-containing sensor histidine kinase [Steroidobacteraceae bacterium]
MLHEFLTANRSELIHRCRLKTAKRDQPSGSASTFDHGIPQFLDQLIETLELERTSDPARGLRISGPSGGSLGASEIAVTAVLHGRELSAQGFTVDQVVHAYGDLCQAVTDLAAERQFTIEVEEFGTLNRCIDNGIADAVTEYVFQRDSLLENRNVKVQNEQLGFLAHELRNLLHTAALAVMAIRTGNVGMTGATGALLDRSLIGMRNLIDRSLADVRLTAGMTSRVQRISLADFIADAKISASLEAQCRECRFTVGDVDPELALEVDRELMLSAVGNLVQNAFKFTHPHTEVRLNAYAAAERIRIDVEDHCGGLPQGFAEEVFRPFKQSGEDRSGMGLGLAICQQTVEANRGILRVRNVVDSGCIFTIDLPRFLLQRPE